MGPSAATSSSNNSNTNNHHHDLTTKTANDSLSANRSLKKSTDSQLKSSVIEFMKARPFLWNKRHPGYKDHKRRDHEFQEFSSTIGYSVQEIKRVWHVLRTNFFRAHKILSEKPQSGRISAGASPATEKVWRYYTAMLYILEGSNLEPTRSVLADSSRSYVCEGRSSSERTRRVSNRLTNSLPSSAFRDANGLNGGKQIISINGSSGAPADTSSANISANNLSTFIDSHLDEDDDFLYARSLSLTLRKFDPTTKEVVKLKFQEIIVDYMQRRQQSQQQQSHLQPQQQLLSQLEPPPPSEIATMETSLTAVKRQAPVKDVT